MNTDDFGELRREIEGIKARSARVEADKAWETSQFRILTITFITYMLATLVLYVIGIEKPYLGSLIPTLGFFLSVQSLPVVKRHWVKNYLERKD